MKTEQLEKIRDQKPGMMAVRMPRVGGDLGLWTLYGVSGLVTAMNPGRYRSVSASTLLPSATVATTANITLPDNTTSKIYATFAVAKAESAGMKVYEVTGYTIDNDTSIPTDTFDISTDTDGDLHYEIGEVVTLAGVITSITQTQTEEVVLTFPLIPIYLIPGGASNGDVLVWDSGLTWETPGAGCE